MLRFEMKYLFAVALIMFGGLSYAEDMADYRLGGGDRVKIEVSGEPDLSMEFRLSEPGVISYPFLGDIRVKGLTVSGLQDRIFGGLRGDYLVSPNVNVTVLEYRPFFIYGEVKSPGGLAYQPGLTVSKAIALAGGFTERASRSRITLSRNGDEDDSRRVSLSDPVKPGDILTIEQSFF